MARSDLHFRNITPLTTVENGYASLDAESKSCRKAQVRGIGELQRKEIAVGMERWMDSKYLMHLKVSRKFPGGPVVHCTSIARVWSSIPALGTKELMNCRP